MKDIPGYEKEYAITTDGRIWSYPKKNHHAGKWMKNRIRKDGLVVCPLVKSGKSKKHLVSRLVAITYIPTSDFSLYVFHKNGIAGDNRVENLEWKSIVNMNNDLIKRHAHSHSVRMKKMHNIRKKLTITDVNNIYKDRKKGLIYSVLTKKYSICENTVRNIITGKTYKECLKD